MRLDHATEPISGIPVENTFRAFNSLQEEIGQAVVQSIMADTIFPGIPHRLFIRVQCQPEARESLYGASLARALQLVRKYPDTPARIYTECKPEDTELMTFLESMGFINDDALIRMHKVLRPGPIIDPLPQGCIIIQDKLEEESECKYFLRRYNAMFGYNKNQQWLNGIKNKRFFNRILAISETGLAGEMLLWEENNCGVAGIILTIPVWQRKGVAKHLMEQARLYWQHYNLHEAYMDVWTSLTGAMRLAGSTGFRASDTLMLYPGFVVNSQFDYRRR